ncbi:F-box At4g18380-like [Olea europaea subsp. europaea]|uniref:F-box At4g18380-like n=1 Tax=Olea europaea subsp. europaea TaxID=158383 RepID=A0A8S0S5B1_OLEEU|nr:F-box At4g18380-like [Olea europaea subsp. europaea]
MDDHELKLRIRWTISRLMASSARHYLIQEIVKERDMIEKIEVTDESEQGRNKLKRNLMAKDSFFEIKTRYGENLELPESSEVLEVVVEEMM